MTDHTSPTLPEPTDQTRRDRRAMLAAIALADGLPAPHYVSFIDDRADADALLSVHLDAVADGLVWAAHFGAAATTRTRDDGSCVLHVPGDIVWHGWCVLLYANDPAAAVAQPLPAGTVGRLTALVSQVAA